MTERSQRRAVERKTRKAEQKKLRNQQSTAARAIAISESAQPLNTQPQVAPTPIATRPLHIAAAAASPVPADAVSISPAQRAANRINAQLSHGPSSEQGKAIASRNNFRHGLTRAEGGLILLDSESGEEYAQFRAGFEAEWQPQTSTECDLVSRLVNHSWLRRRAARLQMNFVNPQDGIITDQKDFNLYRRYEVQHERAFNKALSDLMRLRALRTREQNGFESQRRKEEKHEYQIRHLKHREKLQWYAESTAEARLTLAQGRALAVRLPETGPQELAAGPE